MPSSIRLSLDSNGGKLTSVGMLLGSSKQVEWPLMSNCPLKATSKDWLWKNPRNRNNYAFINVLECANRIVRTKKCSRIMPI